MEPPSLGWAIAAGLVHRDFDGWRVTRYDRIVGHVLIFLCSTVDRQGVAPSRSSDCLRKELGNVDAPAGLAGDRRSPEALARQGPVAGPVVTEITHPVRAKIERYELTGRVIRRTSFNDRASHRSLPRVATRC